MQPEKTYDQVLTSAEEELWLGFERAKAKAHRGLRGSSRELSLASFLESQLPDRFAVTTGEAVDAKERRTGQLDIVIFDRNRTAPLLADATSCVLPAECLLAVVEVKSVLTQDELNSCAKAAKKVADLMPHGKRLLPPRQDGIDASDGNPRCQYSVIAYKSNLGETGWAQKEWARLLEAAKAAEVEPNRIDRVLVLERGMLIPPSQRGRALRNGRGMLRDWFLHLSNFLVREADRRPAFDFQSYGRKRQNRGWEELG